MKKGCLAKPWARKLKLIDLLLFSEHFGKFYKEVIGFLGMFSKTAYLEILGLTLPLDWNQEYYDDGYRKDLIRYALDLKLHPDMDSAIREAWVKKYNQDYKEASGITQSVDKSWLWLLRKKEVHIAYHRFENVVTQDFVRGRQETMALDAFDQSKRLEDALMYTHGFSFLGIETRRIPDVGGIYGLLKNNYTVGEIARHGNWQIRNSLKDFLARQGRKKIARKEGDGHDRITNLASNRHSR